MYTKACYWNRTLKTGLVNFDVKFLNSNFSVNNDSIPIKFLGGLPLITYASRGGGGINTNAYKCVQGGRGGLNMTKNTHFVPRFIENATLSETFKP